MTNTTAEAKRRATRNAADFEMPDLAALKKRGLRGMLEDYERHVVLLALEAARGNQRRAAVALGILPSTLCEKIKRLGIRHRTYYNYEAGHH